MKPWEKVIGMKFGKLTVIGNAGCNHYKCRLIECRCDCGKITITRLTYLKNGHTNSCGCMKAGNHRTHGKYGTGTHNSWNHMRDRCNNPNSIQYNDYGGRGIKVCERWLIFENFLVDMGERPEKHSIERLDRNGNYEPNNCKWANAVVQGMNKKNNRLLTYNGITQTCSQWSRETDLTPKIIHQRLKAGWSIDKVLRTPARVMRRAA